MNWTDQWVKLLGACVSVSTGAAAIRDLRGVPKKVKRAEIDKKAESKEPEKSEEEVEGRTKHRRLERQEGAL